jgi:cell division protease FtsH
MTIPLNIDPSKYVSLYSNEPIGETYTYSKFIDELSHKCINGITFFNDGKSAVVIDNDFTTDVHSTNLHYVHILPNSYNYIMDIAKELHVDVDMMNVPINLLDKFIDLCSQGATIFIGYIIIAAVIRGIFMRNNKGNDLSSIIPGGISTKSDNIVDVSSMNTTFADIAGCDEAKFELEEIVDFLNDSSKYNEAGAKTPKGILLEGNPGTGKTLLAKAVANEAGVPFLSASGSEFIEMFVGVGAARVRNLFEKAKENAPCVIFIDEIDAIGRQRGAGIAGGNDEREQTLNQILTNMDGFEENSGIVVLAATNRIDVLDSALLRPGRFDRKIKVPLPDFEGRKKIAAVHFNNKKIKKDVNFDELSSLTTGFSGADIANLANEAAIYSVRKNETEIDRDILLEAYEKITIGLNSYTQEKDETIIQLVSFHETGHALMACLFPQFFDVRKVTINANKNGAGGYTLFTPKEAFTKYATKKFLLANLIIAMGGRAAEVYLNNINYKPSQFDAHVFKGIKDLDITTGASNDLLQANQIAKDYITKYGFGELFGLCKDVDTEKPFVGKSFGENSDGFGDTTKNDIDSQVAQLVEFAYDVALELIQLHQNSFLQVVDLLKEERIIDGSVILSIIESNTEEESIQDISKTYN